MITVQLVWIGPCDRHRTNDDRPVSLPASAVQITTTGWDRPAACGNPSVPLYDTSDTIAVAFNVGVLAIRIERIDRLRQAVGAVRIVSGERHGLSD